MGLAVSLAFGQCRWACDRSTLIWAKDRASDVPLFRVVKDNKVGYIDATGHLVIPHKFDLTFNYLWDFIEGLAPVQVDQKWGFSDPNGKLVIPAIFEWVSPFSEGRALVRLGSGGPPYRIGFIDKDGKFVGDANLDGGAQPFSEGLSAVALANRKWAYMDKSGKIAVEPRYAWARSFSEGLARVIPKGGCEVMEDICDCMDVPADPGDRTQAANPQSPLPACEFSYIEKGGKIVLTGFQNTQEFSEGVAGVRRSRLWGFIAKDGSQVIPERFQNVKPFHEGLAAVQMGGKWGFIDSVGKIVITPQFDNTEGFSEGVGLVWLNQRFMFINKHGDQLFGRTFSVASPFAVGLAHVALGQRNAWDWAYINHEGTVVHEYRARQ